MKYLIVSICFFGFFSHAKVSVPSPTGISASANGGTRFTVNWNPITSPSKTFKVGYRYYFLTVSKSAVCPQYSNGTIYSAGSMGPHADLGASYKGKRVCIYPVNILIDQTSWTSYYSSPDLHSVPYGTYVDLP